jgi:O-antigen/teichoic acid export membrane protein
MKNLNKSIGIAFLTQYSEMLIQFVGMMILARIITSEQVGIFSVAAFLMALLHVFRDFGVAKYIVQAPTLSSDNIRSALGVAIILAWAVALVLLSFSNVLASFYDEPEIRPVLFVMSASFAVTPVGSIIGAILRRNMQLKELAVVRVSCVVVHIGVALACAFLGYGAMSLAWANFASIVVYGVVAVVLCPPGVSLMPSFHGVREILSFGGIASLGSMAKVAGTNSPDVVVAKAISLAATGYFSRGNGLVQMFNTLVGGAITPLILPYFAQLRRENKDMVEPYKLAITNLTGFAWPFFGVMALLAFPLVRTLYGDHWDVSIPLVRILCLAAIISTLASFATEVMIAYGHVKAVTAMQLMVQPVRVLAVVAGALVSLEGVAVGLVLAEAIVLLFTSRQLWRTNGVPLGAVLRATAKSAQVTAITVVGPALLVLAWPRGQLAWAELAAGGAAALCGWLIAVFWTAHPIRQYIEQAQLRYWPGAPWAKR